MQVQSLGSEDPPAGGQGNPLQYSCLENSMDSEAWRAIVHRVPKGQTQLKQLSTHTPAIFGVPWPVATYSKFCLWGHLPSLPVCVYLLSFSFFHGILLP